MATYPPVLPPADRTDSTISATNHASDHNKVAVALATIIAELGGNPSGGYANIESRLLGVATGTDQAALDAFDEAREYIEGLVITDLGTTDGQAAALVDTPTSQLAASIRALVASRNTLNILDFGVTRGTTSSQTAAIKAAFDANPGRTFYFPSGDYRLDTGLVVSARNNIVMERDTRLFAGATMTTLLSYTDPTAGYADDRCVVGGILDGALKADRLFSVAGILHMTHTQTIYRDGIHRGLVLEGGTGAELMAYDLRFVNSGVTNVTDNIAIEAKDGGDSHFRDIIMRDWTVGVKDTGANRWRDVHPWIGPDAGGSGPQMTARYATSVGFDITGQSNMLECLSDTMRVAYKFRTNGTGYTPRATLLDCRATWSSGTLPTDLAVANPAVVFDNTDGVGFIADRSRLTGHSGAPAAMLAGPTTGVTTNRTETGGYIKGYSGTVGDPLDYRNGVLCGVFVFVPTIYGSTSAGTHTYDAARSGRMVVTPDEVTYYVRMKVTLDGTTGFAGAPRIGGLPLPPGATSIRDAVGSVGLSAGIMVSSAFIYSNSSPYITLLAALPAANPDGGGIYQGATEVQIPNVAGGQNLRGKTIDLVLRVTTTHVKT